MDAAAGGVCQTSKYDATWVTRRSITGMNLFVVWITAHADQYVAGEVLDCAQNNALAYCGMGTTAKIPVALGF